VRDPRAEPALQLSNAVLTSGGGPGVTPARRRLALVAVTAAMTASACAPEREAGTVQPTIEEVLARHTPALVRLEGVEGTGQALCEGRPCIRVYIERASVAASLPAELEGFPVDPVVTGPFTPQGP
jgi:hypothetical protein